MNDDLLRDTVRDEAMRYLQLSLQEQKQFAAALEHCALEAQRAAASPGVDIDAAHFDLRYARALPHTAEKETDFGSCGNVGTEGDDLLEIPLPSPWLAVGIVGAIVAVLGAVHWWLT